jgi:hypothetical protein
MPQTILTAKPLGDLYGSKSTPFLCNMCPKCQFTDVWKKNTGGAYAPGKWQNALVKLDAVAADSKIRQQNVNDWLKHVPVVVIPKGTEFLHVTASSAWVKGSVVGGNTPDGYSFFTSNKYGFAATHGSHFSARIKMRLREDVHGFFLPQYDLITKFTWTSTEVSRSERRNQPVNGPWVEGAELRREPRGTPGEEMVVKAGKGAGTEIRILMRERIDSTKIDLGTTLVKTIMETWPADIRPALLIGCSECEFIFQNSVIYRLMDTTGIATSEDHFAQANQKGRKIVHFSELPTPPGQGSAPGLDKPPAWMGPSRADLGRLKQIQTAISSKTLEDQKHRALFAD